MITQTAELAMQVLLYLSRQQGGDPLPPAVIAEALGASKSYTAKVCGSLARAGILRSIRGARGGVRLVADPQTLTLLAIVEAAQGKVLAHYCGEPFNMQHVCNWHRAMDELHRATTGVLGKWTLAELLRCPFPTGPLGTDSHCRIAREGFDWLRPPQ